MQNTENVYTCRSPLPSFFSWSTEAYREGPDPSHPDQQAPRPSDSRASGRGFCTGGTCSFCCLSRLFPSYGSGTSTPHSVFPSWDEETPALRQFLTTSFGCKGSGQDALFPSELFMSCSGWCSGLLAKWLRDLNLRDWLRHSQYLLNKANPPSPPNYRTICLLGASWGL